MQEQLKINLISPTERGCLYYHPDPQLEPGMFFIDSLVARMFAYTVNINGGEILLRADETHTLMKVEFLCPRRYWQKVTLLEVPQPVQANAIEFAIVPTKVINFLGASSEFDADITYLTDEDYSAVHIVVGKIDGESEQKWIALSSECFALVVGDELRGFYIKLIKTYRNKQEKETA